MSTLGPVKIRWALCSLSTDEQLIGPTVHMNGTARVDLLRFYVTALDALRKAERAVAEAGPNGRDYYVQMAGNFETALEQHRRRTRMLAAMISELTTIAESL